MSLAIVSIEHLVLCIHDGTGQAFHDITHKGLAAIFLSVIPLVIDQVVQKIDGRTLVLACFVLESKLS